MSHLDPFICKMGAMLRLKEGMGWKSMVEKSVCAGNTHSSKRGKIHLNFLSAFLD
jgi:hypothetical protein